MLGNSLGEGKTEVLVDFTSTPAALEVRGLSKANALAPALELRF
jgi:hypothetical protein